MRRREFIAGLGSAVAWPMAARAQQRERMRRVGVLMPYIERDTDARLSYFVQGLGQFGWIGGRNLHMDVRWAAGNLEQLLMYANELVALQPDAILVDSTPGTAALQRLTKMIPIVFVTASDPIGSGFVAGLPRPSGNLTGFIAWEPSMSGKWLQFLKEIAPDVNRVAALFNPDTAPYVISNYLPSFQDAARLLKVEPMVAPIHSDADIGNLMITLGREPRGSLVVMPDQSSGVYYTSIIALAARYHVPAIYHSPGVPRNGGLLSYGPDDANIYRGAASYVDHILRGTEPSDLPVQPPTKFELVINLKTAKALGLTISETLLATADEVIQ
jgi:putative tryptophan/tyrosine transport system substrate-binding protein